MEEKGCWLCECGKENTDVPAVPQDDGHGIQCDCGKQMKLIRRDLMTGQEKYESDRDRKDAEKLLAGKREEIASKETDATAKYFSQQAASARALADSIRKL